MTRCHGCGAGVTRTFYAAREIPVHSCLMMTTRGEALAYPRRDLELGFCSACGFVQNNAFDPGVHQYSQQYEETQGFSARFNTFQDELIERLVRDHDLRHKTVLEIGCGKGEFLVRLCELGDCRGIGIDPGYRPERTTSEAASRIEFINDFYGPEHAHLRPDAVACRHTLEHIQPVREFVQQLRRTIGDREDTLVFFEVPDVLRVLEEQAFWDIYYEHCSYFSLGSLARLFRRCDFGLLDLWTGFDDQYLMLVCKPGPGVERLAGEDDLAKVTGAVDRFERDLPGKLAHWRRELRAAREAGKRAVIWGSGSKAVSYLTTLDVRDEIEYVVDINPHKHGTFLAGTGHEIVAPSFLAEYRPDIVIVMNPVYADEIRDDCAKMGVAAQFVTV